MKYLVTITVSLLLISLAASQPNMTESDFEHFHNQIDLEELEEEVNQNQEDIPSFVKSIVGDQRINIEFKETDENYSAVLKGTEIQELDNRSLENPTLEVEVNESSMAAVMESEQPADELKEALDEGEIEYETLTATNTVRMFITERVLDIASRFDVL